MLVGFFAFLVWVVQNLEKLFGLEAVTAVTLALFHTTFNVLGVLLMFPLSKRQALFLDKRFVIQEEVPLS